MKFSLSLCFSLIVIAMGVGVNARASGAGALNINDGGSISGYSQSHWVEVKIDGYPIGTYPAWNGIFINSQFSDTGFWVPTPKQLLDGQTHILEVSDLYSGLQLENSPQTLCFVFDPATMFSPQACPKAAPESGPAPYVAHNPYANYTDDQFAATMLNSCQGNCAVPTPPPSRPSPTPTPIPSPIPTPAPISAVGFDFTYSSQAKASYETQSVTVVACGEPVVKFTREIPGISRGTEVVIQKDCTLSNGGSCSISWSEVYYPNPFNEDEMVQDNFTISNTCESFGS